MSNLREERIKHGYTLKQIGSMIGVSEASVSLYETGKREPSNDTLRFLADLYGVTVDYLLGREETASARPASEIYPTLVVDISGSMKQGKSETAAIIASIMAKLEQLDEEGRKTAEEHIDFLLERKRKGEA